MTILKSKPLIDKQRVYLETLLEISTCILSSERALIKNVLMHESYYEQNSSRLNKIVQEFEMEKEINKIYDL